MQVITINNKQYYSSKDIKTSEQPKYYEGCGVSNSRFLKKYDLDEDVDYNYVAKDKVTGAYVISRNRARGTLLLISKDWIDNFGKPSDNTQPPVLEINPFVDDEGKTYDVEIRGTRNYNDCYFLASDIASCFGIKKLQYNITRTNKKYTEGVHYRYFVSEHGLVNLTKPCSESKRLFLTYKGLMLALFSSITPTASKFIDWACEVVFTAHMGTQEQKLALSADLIGLSKDQVKQFFDTCASEISGLYLIRLGTVSKLRKVFQIPEEYPDHLYVHKFGRSNNIATRFQQHVRSYAKLKIYDIKLIYYCPIDSELVPKAEADLRNHFDAYGMKLENDEHTEIAIFEEKGKTIKGVFTQLFKIHMTTNIALINKLKESRMEVELLKEKLLASEQRQTDLEEKLQMKQNLSDLQIKTLESKIRRRDKTIAKLKASFE